MAGIKYDSSLKHEELENINIIDVKVSIKENIENILNCKSSMFNAIIRNGVEKVYLSIEITPKHQVVLSNNWAIYPSKIEENNRIFISEVMFNQDEKFISIIKQAIDEILSKLFKLNEECVIKNKTVDFEEKSE